MSGLCGWLAPHGQPNQGAVGDGARAEASAALLAAMAAPLARFDASAVTSVLGGAGAAAVAAGVDSSHVFHKDGLLIALWGRPTLSQAGALDGAARVPALAARLAQLWRNYGPNACASLAGPFALCILDELSGEALLAVDRSGTHSLYYQSSSRQGLLFASSADALIAHPAAGSGLDPQALYNYLYFHTVPGPGTIYAGQQRLLPGEYLHYRAGRLSRGAYWTMAYQEAQAQPFKSLKAEFLGTLRRSVEESVGPNGTGAFLSGGTDSSTLACVLGQVSGRAARTYSIGFDAPGYDEMAYARLAASHFGTEHHELYVTADDVVKAVPRIAAVFDQPFGNASAVAAFYCAEMARADGVTRLLGGDGGDELFGGNERYARQAQFARYERVPALLRQVVLEPLLFKLASGQQQKLLCKARSYIEQATLPLPARLESYNLLQRYGHHKVLDDEFLLNIDPGAPMGSLNEAYWLTDGNSQINQMMALDLKFTLADNDLPKVVKACELAGVEVAFPFLNDAMVAFSARLAPQQKLNGTRLRYFFKQALRDILPRAIIRKEKHGFGLPFGLWLQSHQGLRQLAFDSLSDLKGRGIVRASFIDELQTRHLAEHPAYHGTMVWVLMMLEQWFKQRQVEPRVAP
ncbi:MULTISPECIES: asparagine synthetase B family protein [unclassified Janthinobacterium]|uniref:asparagine synthetase B family protein n=1 Tax=unclassified Janthinobacterium TaxID=2610881 RepID=UPI00034D765B|nr:MULTISPECIES: asparagine synthase-related protein [unclassified Janthinobacterium]MEC5161286.1 asparagine synthase (glutamine-hydrolyzing) [Janthinobacterium sp. CG_S6]